MSVGPAGLQIPATRIGVKAPDWKSASTRLPVDFFGSPRMPER